MQIDNAKEKRFRNSFHCLSSIIRDHGFRTLFTGWGITTIKDCSYYSAYFFVYEGVKGTLQKNIDLLEPIGGTAAAIPMAGGAAGVAAWSASYPFDCVRAGLQSKSLNDGKTPTTWQVLRDMIRRQGILGLYAGVTPALVRASIAHSVRFSAYEGILWLLRNMRQGEATSSRRSSSFSFPPFFEVLTGKDKARTRE